MDRVKQTRLELSDDARDALRRIVASEGASRGHVRRARVVLLTADDVPGVEIARRLGLSVGQVSRIRRRFEHGGVEALADKPHPGRRDHGVSCETIHRVLALSSSAPPPGRRRWSTRLIGSEVGLTSATVAKILRLHSSGAHK
jgi:transposase